MISATDLTVKGRLSSVSFQFGSTARIAVLGPSGAGKSSLAALVTGALSPDSGSITLPTGNLGWIPQDPGASLLPHRPIVDSLLEVVVIRHGSHSPEYRRATDRLPTLLSAMDLPERTLSALPNELSGGQRQRVAIARAYVSDPEIMLIDEGLSALDTSTRQLLEGFIDRSKAGLILITHSMSSALRLCDACIFLEGGRVLYYGDIEGLATQDNASIVSYVRASEELER